MDINKATADELARSVGIDASRARNIVNYGKTKGGFRTWEDVRRATDFDPELVGRLQSAGFGIELGDEQAIGAQRSLNSASVQELEESHLIDSEGARRIVEYRQRKGEFTTWEEVKAATGLADSAVKRLQQGGFELGSR